MIVVVGSANVDFVTRVSHIPAPGETVLGESYVTAAGGKGANQAVACARAGARVAFVGALGRDPFASMLRESLRVSGVEDRTRAVDAPTGAAFISVSAQGENAITVAAGANLHVPDVPCLDWMEVSHLVLQLEIPLPTVMAYAQAAKAAGVRVVLNAAPLRSFDPALLGLVDLLVVNEGELGQLVGQAEVETQLTAAQRLGPSTVVVTLGERGCRARQGTSEWRVPALKVNVLDTTGAGDTFVGVLVAALSEGQEFAAALRRATVGAALACTRSGAQPSMPTRQEIDMVVAELQA